MTTNENWNLESIFAGGSQSTALAECLTTLADDLTAFEQRDPLAELSAANQAAWVETIETVYELSMRLNQAGSFVGCLVSQNVKDDHALQRMAQLDELSAQLGTVWTQLAAHFAAQHDDAWQALMDEAALKPVSFQLHEQRDLARQKMSAPLESLANELATDGYHAWNRLYGVVSGSEEVLFDDEPLSVGQLQNRYQDHADRDVRRRAFELYESTWSELAKTCVMSLNYQAGFRLTLYKHRGWQSVLHEPLVNNRLTQATLDAMWGAIDAKSGKLLDYFAAKAKLFGATQLEWYDVYAPVGSVNRTFTYAEAGDYVVDSMRRFNPDIADFCRMAIDNRWIEAENRPGKRAGAYCTSLPSMKESRIFMTYNGSYNGLLTLAHELGHGYHTWVMRHLAYGARQYTMSVAETASTFNELVVNDASYQAATDDQERFSLLGSKLNDAAAMLMNIRSRYDFERAFFAERAKKSLSIDELNGLMVAAQQTAFKNGLASYHPHFWASKLHFHITGAPFYNFPYTFGYLFSNGVYAQALAEGPAFVQRYKALLQDTGSMTTEQLAQTHLGVDLTQADFWETTLDRILGDVDEFVTLAEKMG